MDKFNLGWLWFVLAIAALATAVAAKAMAALFYVAAIVFLGVGIWFLLKKPKP